MHPLGRSRFIPCRVLTPAKSRHRTNGQLHSIAEAIDLVAECFLMAGLADGSAEKRRCLRAELLTLLSKYRAASDWQVRERRLRNRKRGSAAARCVGPQFAWSPAPVSRGIRNNQMHCKNVGRSENLQMKAVRLSAARRPFAEMRRRRTTRHQ